MDSKYQEIIKRLELGEPLSKICRDKSLPSLSAVYKAQREDESLQKKIRNARETGVYTLLDKIAEDMEIPKSNQEMHFIKEKWQHIRWIASKLASNVFADRIKSDIKQDVKMVVSWGAPNDETNMLQAKKIIDQVSSVDVKDLPRTSITDTKA